MEQNCQFINALGQRCPIQTFASDKCCSRHICRYGGCYNIIVNQKNKWLCQEHINSEKPVNAPVSWNFEQPEYYCVYIDRNDQKCNHLTDKSFYLNIFEPQGICQRHMCQFFERDPSGWSCYYPIKDDFSRYCVNHSSQCTYIISIESGQTCQNECQSDEDACFTHRCKEYRCTNKVVDLEDKVCEYHRSINNFLLYEFSS